MLIPFKDIVRKYGKPNGVLHLGANVGEEAPAYYENGVEKVLWFEGNPELHETLNANISKYPGQTAYNNCVGDYDGRTVLHISNNGSQSSSVLDLGTHKTAHPEVHYVKDIPVNINRIDSLFPLGVDGSLNGLDFLNIDLQGFELQALKGMGKILEHFKWAYLEVNKAELYKGCALIGEIDSYMGGFGFKRVETKWCGSTGWGDALYIKR